jgi:flagella basal body P-ring formation protein FlgA
MFKKIQYLLTCFLFCILLIGVYKLVYAQSRVNSKNKVYLVPGFSQEEIVANREYARQVRLNDMAEKAAAADREKGITTVPKNSPANDQAGGSDCSPDPDQGFKETQPPEKYNFKCSGQPKSCQPGPVEIAIGQDQKSKAGSNVVLGNGQKISNGDYWLQKGQVDILPPGAYQFTNKIIKGKNGQMQPDPKAKNYTTKKCDGMVPSGKKVNIAN